MRDCEGALAMIFRGCYYEEIFEEIRIMKSIRILIDIFLMDTANTLILNFTIYR